MGVVNYYCMGGEIIGDSGAGDYMRDALGSVTATASPTTGAVQNTYRYKPCGNLLVKTGSAPDPKNQFVGTAGYRKTAIAHSSSYVRARHLSNEEGMWTSVDPLWPDESPLNYCSGSPTVYIDASGSEPAFIIPRNLFCPQNKGGLRPCSVTKRGYCPNQGPEGGVVNLTHFNSKGRSDDENSCDPSSADKEAIRNRLVDLETIKRGLCGGAPGPAGGYEVWVETNPCWRPGVDSGQTVSCAIRCYPNLFGNQKLGSIMKAENVKMV